MGAVLRLPGVLPLFLAACIGRLPMGALGLLMILSTHEATGSFARGGVVAAAYTLSIGLSSPVLARVVDRTGQTLVLRVGSVIAGAAMAGFAFVPQGAPIGALIGLSAVAGLAQPPLGACMRALWPVLAPDPHVRHAALAMESVALEGIYIAGPVLIVGGIGALSLTAALLFCSVAVIVGDVAFSAHPASRSWRPVEVPERHMLGALRAPGVRVLVAVFALCGLAVGAVEVAVPATLEPLGKTSLTGPLLGLWGVGSMLAGVVVARAGAAGDPPRRLAAMLALWGAAHAALALAWGAASLGLLLLIAGVAIAPTLIYANAMLDALAPEGTLTEAFTWTTAGITAGIAGGAGLAGVIVEAASPSLAFGLLGGGGLVAAVLVRAASGGALAPARPPAAVHAGS
jgi:MFS family permease